MFKKILMVGCGRQGASFVAALAARAPKSLEKIILSVGRGDAVASARIRLADALAREIADKNASLSRLSIYSERDLVVERSVLEGVGCVLIQVPPGLEYCEYDPRNPEFFQNLRIFCESVAPDAAFALYSAAGEITWIYSELLSGRDQVAMHYLYPASLMLPIELAAESKRSVDAAYALSGLLQESGFEPLVFEEPACGYLSTRLHTAILDLMCRTSGRGQSLIELADPFDSVLARLGSRISKLALEDGLYPSKQALLLDEPAQSSIEEEIVDTILGTCEAVAASLERNCVRSMNSQEAQRATFRSLACGAALRWQRPGFCRFTDLAGIPAFLGLLCRIHPECCSEPMEELIFSGRVGLTPWNKRGFYEWSDDVQAVLDERDSFLKDAREKWISCSASC